MQAIINGMISIFFLKYIKRKAEITLPFYDGINFLLWCWRWWRMMSTAGLTTGVSRIFRVVWVVRVVRIV
jgi:hypothetical protein